MKAVIQLISVCCYLGSSILVICWIFVYIKSYFDIDLNFIVTMWTINLLKQFPSFTKFCFSSESESTWVYSPGSLSGQAMQLGLWRSNAIVYYYFYCTEMWQKCMFYFSLYTMYTKQGLQLLISCAVHGKVIDKQ